jgi:hypothetical protein
MTKRLLATTVPLTIALCTVVAVLAGVLRLKQLSGAWSGYKALSQADIWFVAHRFLLIPHIAGALLFVALYPVQRFLVRRGCYKAHARVGLALSVALAISVLTAIPLGVLFPYGQKMTQAVTVTVLLLILYCLYVSITSIRKGLKSLHAAWIMRAYCLLLMTSVLRVQVVLLSVYQVPRSLIEKSVILSTTILTVAIWLIVGEDRMR